MELYKSNHSCNLNLEVLDGSFVLVWDFSAENIHDAARGTRTQGLRSGVRTLNLQTTEPASNGINV